MRYAHLRGITAVLAMAGLSTAMSPAHAQTPIDVLGSLPLADYNNDIAPQTYKDWGNEPFIAVNPLAPDKIVISSFAFGTPGASLWYSTDGGSDWGLRFPITNPAPNVDVPNDQTYAYDNRGILHGVFLSESGGGGTIYHGTTPDPNNDGVGGRPATQWSWTPGQLSTNTGYADQPWIALGQKNGQTQVVAAYDSFNSNYQNVEVDAVVSTDGGRTFGTPMPISSGGQVPYEGTNPGLRLATDGKGNVYSVFGIGSSRNGSTGSAVDYRLNRYSGGTAWDFTNSFAGLGGLAVASGSSRQFGFSFGGVNQLQGNVTAIATDKSGTHIYVVYGRQDAAGIDRLYLAEFVQNPSNSADLIERSNPLALSVLGQEAALPSVAVTDNGTVVIEYDSFSVADGKFHVHLTNSYDQGLTFADSDLYDFTAPAAPGSNGFPDRTRIFGDYQFVTALGNTVYGTFAARGNVDAGGIDTTDKIDPFFFKFAAAPEPAPLSVLSLGTLGLGLMGLCARRRRSALPSLKVVPSNA